MAVTTCIGSGQETLGGDRWDNVVMDECTQSVLPSTLVPLNLGAKRVNMLQLYLYRSVLHLDLTSGFQPNPNLILNVNFPPPISNLSLKALTTNLQLGS